jgi:hypothetical protein
MEINKGLHKQGLDNTKPSGSWVQALNIEYTKDLKSITNCRGNIKLNFELPDGYTCVGTIETPNEVVVFLQGTESTFNDVFAIGRLKEDSFDVVFKVPNHKINHEILGTYKFNYKDELIVIWCNGNYVDSDNLRIVNLDTLPFEVDANKFIEAVNGVGFEITKVNSNISYPLLDFINSVEPIDLYKEFIISGALKTGTYQFFLNYEKNGIKTNYFILTNEIIIANIENKIIQDASYYKLGGFNYPNQYEFNYVNNETSNKGIKLKLRNLDNKYEYYNLICKYTNLSNVESYYIVNKYSITEVDVEIKTFPENSTTDAELIDTINISKVHALTAYNNRLYIGNYSTDEEVNLQDYCYDIELELERDINGQNDKNKITKSFQEGEVYAFYIHFVYKNGQTSKGFHIKGKELNGFEVAYNVNEYYENGVGVTHHFIPYASDLIGYYRPVVKYGVKVKDGNLQSVLSTIISNPNIDSKVKEAVNNIQGYFLSYAKRTLESSRILGTGALFNTDFVGEVNFGNIDFIPTISITTNVTNWWCIEDNTGVEILRPLPYIKNDYYYTFYEYGLLDKKPQLNIDKIKLLYQNSDPYSVSFDVETKFEKYNVDNNSASVPSNANKETNILLTVYNKGLIDINSIGSVVSENFGENIKLLRIADDSQNFWVAQLINDSINNYYYKFDEQKTLIKFSEVLKINESRISYNGDVFVADNEFIKGWSAYHRLPYRFTTMNVYNPFLRQYDSENDTKLGLSNTNRVPINNSKYNEGFNKQATTKVKESFNKDLFLDNINSFKLNVARSRVQQSESLEENWIKFDALEYRTLDQKRQEIISLKSDNRLIYAQTRNSLFVFQTKDEIVTANDIVASLGNSDMFSTTPVEILYNDKGIIGCNSRFSNILIPNGYITLDTTRNNIFLVQGTSPKLISNSIEDLKSKWTTIEYEDSPAINNKGNRLFLDLTDNKNILYLFNYNGANSFNLSYNLLNGQFVSFHSFIPINICGDRKNIYSMEDQDIYIYNQDNMSLYFGNQYDSYIDVVLSNDQVFKLQAIYWDSNFRTLSGVDLYDKTFTSIALYNNKNCTGLLDLTNNRFKTNRGIKNLWHFNNIRDNIINKNQAFITTDRELIDANIANNTNKIKNFFDKSKFFSNFVVVRLHYNNIEQLKFYLNTIKLTGQI